MAVEISPVLKQKCLENMELFDIPQDVRQFCLEAIQLDFDISSIHNDLRTQFTNSQGEGKDNLLTNLESLSLAIRGTLTKFDKWVEKLEKCKVKCKTFHPLNINTCLIKQLKAPFYLRSHQLMVQEGEVIDVIDCSQDDFITVKVGHDKEGTIPILNLILPSSDFNLTSLIERLYVLLLCSWFECFRLFYHRLFQLLIILLESLAYTYPENVSTHAAGPKTSKDLKVLKKIVSRLEADYLKAQDTSKIEASSRDLVEMLSKAYKSYKIFEKFFKNFKVPTDTEEVRPFCIFDKLSEFKSRVSQDKPVKYYKTKITIESVETREEIFHYPATDFSASSTVSEGIPQQTKVESQQLTSSSQEVKRNFTIRSVRDPRNGNEISLNDAINEGVVDMTGGFYVDISNGTLKPIIVAINEGLIKVGAVTETVTKPKVEEMGMITVKSLVCDDHREYKILKTIDPITAEKLTPEEASKRGWLTEQGYKIGSMMMSIDEAIEAGWVQVEYLTPEKSTSTSEPTYEAKTYLVRSVVDPKHSKTVTFAQAISMGIIDVEHGHYVDVCSNEKLSLDEALRKGYVKGRRMREGEDHGTLAIDPGNRVIAKNLAKVKKVVGALAAFSKAGARSRSSGSSSPAVTTPEVAAVTTPEVAAAAATTANGNDKKDGDV